MTGNKTKIDRNEDLILLICFDESESDRYSKFQITQNIEIIITQLIDKISNAGAAKAQIELSEALK